MPQLVGALIIIALYVMAIIWFFEYVAWYIWAAGSAAFAVMILVNYGRAFADCFSKRLPASASEAPSPPEPAFRNYFFRKAYEDYIDIVRRAAEYDYQHGTSAWEWNVKAFFAHPGAILTWPIGVTALAVFAASLLVAAATFILFGVVHLLLVTLMCFIGYALALYLRLVEWVSMAWRRVSYVCPHSECYRPIALPVFVCPSCGALHRKLLPGSYGIRRRRCACGQMLATSSLVGRRRVPARCPHPDCGRTLSGEIGSAVNVHLPIVGGPASGKTSYLVASVLEIQQDSLENGRTVGFVEERDRRAFEASKALFEKGQVVLKTPELSPSSFLLKIAEPNGTSHLIYIYDAAGELYGGSGDVRRRHEYLSYCDGVLFLIDPFSVPQMAVDHGEQISAIERELRPSSERPQDVYDRLTGTLAEFSASRRIAARKPIAVVLTKSDALRGILAGKVRRGGVGEETIGARSPTEPRQWLLSHGEGNLVRSIESDFAEVRYYWCSALGHLPDSGTPFVPVGVIAPIQWILERRAVRVAGEAERGVAWRGEAAANVLGVAVASAVFLLGGLGAGALGMALLPSQGLGEVAGSVRAAVGAVMGTIGGGSITESSYRGSLAAGMRVRRGPDWKWQDQDGGRGSLGTVTAPDREHQGWWWVKWDSGQQNRYRWGVGGAYDLEVHTGKPFERLQTGVVATTSSVIGWRNFARRSDFSGGDQVCVYAEALNVGRGGNVDLGYEFRVFTPENVEMLVRNPRHTRRTSGPSYAAWECFSLPRDTPVGVYRASIVIRDHLAGQVGDLAITFQVIQSARRQGGLSAPIGGGEAGARGAGEERSLEGRIATEVRFENRTAGSVLVYWVNYQGKEVFYRELQPGESYSQPTYVTHPWRVREKRGGNLIRSVVAGETRQVVTIDGSPVVPPHIEETHKRVLEASPLR